MVPFNWGVLSDPNFPTVHFATWRFITWTYCKLVGTKVIEMTVQVVVIEGHMKVKIFAELDMTETFAVADL